MVAKIWYLRIHEGGRAVKRLFILLFIVIMAMPFALNAQQETLLDGKSGIESGFFCGPEFKFSKIGNDFAYLSGIRAALIIDHRVTLGLAGYWLESDLETTVTRTNYIPETNKETPVTGATYTIGVEYGGIDLGYVFLPEQPLFLALNTLVGIGEVTSADTLMGTAEDDEFFIVEPGINVGVNVASWFRVLVGASYRWVDGVQGVPGVRNNDLSGLSGTIMLKFGWF
jgi:hypothetical protein